MEPPPIPPNEAERLASLKALNVLDTPAEERFDRITRLAKKLLGTQIALVSLVDAERQWFKSSQGLTATETPREISFCGHAILDDDTLVVSDASQDPRFASNPLVAADPKIRFYAGHPLKTPTGNRVGTLCVIDSEPREPSADDLQTLGDLAALIERELRVVNLNETERFLREQLEEAERRASIDSLTRLWNRAMVTEILRREMTRAEREGTTLAVVVADLDHFKRVNDTHGHAAGDAVLREASERMRGALRPYDSLGRYGGEEFLAVLVGCDAESAALVAERVRQAIHAAPMTLATGEQLPLTVSLGVSLSGLGGTADAEALIREADNALYEAKRAGRDRVAFAKPES